MFLKLAKMKRKKRMPIVRSGEIMQVRTHAKKKIERITL